MFELAGAGLGLIGTIGKMFARGAANRKLRQLQKEDPVYQSSPIAAQRLGLANTLLNARAPGAAAAEQNIYSNQANATANAERGATDSSQLLLTGGAIQGQTNDAFNQLGQNETADYQRRYGNQVGAQEGMIAEGDKVFNDQTRRFNDKTQFQGAQAANNANNWGDVSNFGMALGNFGVNGGFNSLAPNSNNSNNIATKPWWQR